ncbi:15585_t:CDS:2, partial [Gigaspora rosea]
AELLFREIECYKRLKTCTILFDHIINVEKDRLSIKNLAEHDAWSNYIKSDEQMDLHTNIQDNEFDSLFKNKSFEELINSFYGEDSYYKYLKDPEIDKCINETNLSNLQIYGKDLMNALLNPKKQLDDMNNKIIKQVFMN